MTPLLTIYINPWLLALAVIIVVAIIIIAVILAVRVHETGIKAGKEEMIGRKAIVRTTLAPRGQVFVDDELWNAEIDNGTAEPDEEVTITRLEGLKLYVTRNK
jgi:membrane-bound serine protease (ClpP class)